MDPHLAPRSHGSGSLRAQSSRSRASGAHGGRTGVSALQPLVAVGRCWLRAEAFIAAGIWGVEIPPLVYFHGSPRIPDTSVAASRERWRERAELKRGVEIWRAALRCSSRLVFHWMTVNYWFLSFKISTWKYAGRSSSVSEVRGLIKNRGRTAATFGERIFPFWFFVLFSAFGLLFFSSRRWQVAAWQTRGSGAEARRMLGTLEQPDLLLWDNFRLFFSFGRNPPRTFPLPFVFIFFYRMSVLYNLRMRSGLLLFLFTQIISVASLTQTGRCCMNTCVLTTGSLAEHWSILHHFAPLLPLTCYASAFPVRARLQGDNLDHVNTVFTLITPLD